MSAFSSNEYQSWSFANRSFLFGVAVSILWHLFWFFTVTITVHPQSMRKTANPRMLSLGPVLDDSIIRTLVAARPELSPTFYRKLSDFESATELPTQTVERRESGDVTSLPVGEESLRSLRQLISGQKSSPDDVIHGYFQLQGDLTPAHVLGRPEPPDVNDVRPVEVDFEVDSAGRVVSTSIALSSGDETLDRRWQDHLNQWLFEPTPIFGGDRLKGRATFRRSTVA